VRFQLSILYKSDAVIKNQTITSYILHVVVHTHCWIAYIKARLMKITKEVINKLLISPYISTSMPPRLNSIAEQSSSNPLQSYSVNIYTINFCFGSILRFYILQSCNPSLILSRIPILTALVDQSKEGNSICDILLRSYRMHTSHLLSDHVDTNFTLSSQAWWPPSIMLIWKQWMLNIKFNVSKWFGRLRSQEQMFSRL
jgi:hypothetical protein